jgi:hypothetical protein
MEPEGLLLCSQKCATRPHPEPAESISPHRSLSTQGPSECYTPKSSHLRLDLPSGLFPSSFPTKTLQTPLAHKQYVILLQWHLKLNSSKQAKCLSLFNGQKY